MGSPLKIVIVGSGPAGMYTADAFLKKNPNCQIDIIDKLATPYGLIRSGVAPDHQTTKNVTRAYDKVMRNEKVRFVGNINFGKDLKTSDLTSLYDVVVLAIGTPKDRNLNIPGEELDGVYGAQTFVYWYNAHPEYHHINPNLDIKTACVIGNGNVALDVARVILRSEQEMEKSDLADHAKDEIFKHRAQNVHVIGRRGPAQAQFSNKELGELGDMDLARPVVDDNLIPTDFASDDARELKVVQAKLDILTEYSNSSASDDKSDLYLDFYLSPVEIMGDNHITSLKLEKNELVDGMAHGTGEFITLDCDLLISCIGYEIDYVDGLTIRNGIIDNKEGHVKENIYVVGWAKRGASGTIGTNRIDSQNVVDMILAQNSAGGDANKSGAAGLDEICAAKKIQTVSFSDWEVINAAEIERASDTAPRRKFAKTEDMLEIVQKGID